MRAEIKEKARFRWQFNSCSDSYQWVAVNKSAIDWVTKEWVALRHEADNFLSKKNTIKKS